MELETIEKAIADKTIFNIKIVNVKTNVDDEGHLLRCCIHFLTGPLRNEVVSVWVPWD